MGGRTDRIEPIRAALMRYGPTAAIDCGTNSTRLLIVNHVGTTIVREMRITRLGQDVDATGVLSSAGMDRTLSVLGDFRALMDDADVQQSRLVATSAVRDARNGGEFLKAASGVVGTDAELLSGSEEGRLAFVGATSGLTLDRSDPIVLDIGGGSTELVIRDGSQLQAYSMELGCVRLTERYLASDPPTEVEMAKAIEAIDAQLADAVGAVPWFSRPHSEFLLIGLAGTISTLAGLELGLDRYEHDAIHHFGLTSEAVRRWCQILAAETSIERGRRTRMLLGREDVIVGGTLVLRRIMELLGVTRCLVSESDILDGLVFSMR